MTTHVTYVHTPTRSCRNEECPQPAHRSDGWCTVRCAKSAATHRKHRSVTQGSHRTTGGVMPRGWWRTLLDECGNACLACGSNGPLSHDHVVPVSEGGHHSLANSQVLCRSCNSSKGTRSHDYRSMALIERLFDLTHVPLDA